MEGKKTVIDSIGGYEKFEQLMKRGKQMHNQALYGLIARLLSKVFSSLKQGEDHLGGQKAPKDHGSMLYAGH